VEPYFTSLALYDARACRKLSETFHFDVNHEQARSMLPNDHDNTEAEGEKNGIEKNGLDSHGANWSLPNELQKELKEWAMFPKQVSCSSDRGIVHFSLENNSKGFFFSYGNRSI